MRVGDLLEVSARRYPTRIAVADSERSLTYAEYLKRCRRLANAARGIGLEPGDRVAVLAHNSVTYAEIIVGLASAGIVAVHISDKLTPSEIGYLLVDSEAKTIVFDSSLEETLAAAMAESGWQPSRPPIILGTAVHSSARGYEPWLANARAALPERAPDPMPPFYLGYTSGTTGLPKGAKITHASRVLTAICACAEYGFHDRDVTLMFTPMYHGGPLVFVLTSIAQGGRLVIMPRFDAEEALHVIERESVTNAFVVPTILTRLTQVNDKPSAESLRVLVSNAAPLPSVVKEATLASFPSVQLHEFYGSTEAGIVTNLRPEDQLRKVRCAGQPFLLTEVALLNDEGNPCLEGEVGELYSRSPFLFDGYFGRIDATSEVMRDGMVSAGDMAQVDDEGYIYIVDRKKDLIISGGVNLYPREIEEALIRHPSIREVAVIGVPDREWGESVKAFVVLDSDAADLESVMTEASESLASFKRPKSFESRASLPRTSTGKILRRELRAAEWVGQEANI